MTWRLTQNGVGILVDSGDVMRIICKMSTGMPNKLYICCQKMSLRTPHPLSFVALWEWKIYLPCYSKHTITCHVLILKHNLLTPRCHHNILADRTVPRTSAKVQIARRTLLCCANVMYHNSGVPSSVELEFIYDDYWLTFNLVVLDKCWPIAEQGKTTQRQVVI